MINDLFVPIRRVSVRTRRLMWIAVACGSAYYLSVLQQSMRCRCCTGVAWWRLRACGCLRISYCSMGCARFGAFERVSEPAR